MVGKKVVSCQAWYCKEDKISLITVIIPTYNRQLLLKHAIQSVLEQTVPCAELIVVDDGSSDGTKMLVKEFAGRADISIRYLFQNNKGASAARNLGIKNAVGNILCFLDSDDRFMPNKIALQKQALDTSGCLVSHTCEQWLRRGKHLNQKQKHQPPDGYIFSKCLPLCVVGMSTVMAHRKLFDTYGMFDESLPCCEDYDFWLRVSTIEKFKLVAQPLTVKNGGREDQLSVIYRAGMDKFRINSLVNLLEKTTLTGDQYRLAVHELQRKCEIYGKGCLKYGREEEGLRYLRLPVKYLY